MGQKKGTMEFLSVELMETKFDRNDHSPPSTVMRTNGNYGSQTNTDCDDSSHAIVSGTGAIASCLFLIGVLMFLVGFASHDWLGLEKGVSLSLWTSCERHFLVDVWTCRTWDSTPGFIKAAQCFTVTSLLLYALTVVILIAYLTVQFLQRIRAVIITLCTLIFAAALTTVMALVTIRVIGQEYLEALQKDDRAVLHKYATGVDVMGEFYIGWSFIIVIISAVVTLISFTFCLIELFRVREYC